MDIHNRKQIYEAVLNKLQRSNIHKRNKDLILEFVNYKIEEDEIKIARQEKYLGKLRILAEILKKPFDKATKDDIKRLWKEVKSKDIKVATKQDYAIILKVFFRWLKDEEHPEETNWIKPPKEKRKRLHHTEILNWDDVILLSDAAMNRRDKALVQVLFDSGARIEEILTLLIKDVEITHEDIAATIHIRKSKTFPRSVAIVKSAPALIDWLNNHPLKKDKNAGLWVNLDRNNNPMEYAAVRKNLRVLKHRSKLKKPVNPHHFRKSSVSHWAHYLMPFEAKERFGWTPNSKMFDIYTHINEKKVNDRVLETEGIIKKTERLKQEENLKPQRCKWCDKVNPLGQLFCVVCKRPLNEEKSYLQQHMESNLKNEFGEFIEQNPTIVTEFTKVFIGFMKSAMEKDPCFQRLNQVGSVSVK